MSPSCTTGSRIVPQQRGSAWLCSERVPVLFSPVGVIPHIHKSLIGKKGQQKTA